MQQKKIASFFASAQPKRKATDPPTTSEPETKKAKEEKKEDGLTQADAGACCVKADVSADVEALIQKKKAEALARRQAKMSLGEKYQLEAAMGPSWLVALSGEFEKPYFNKLKEFLADEKKKGAVVYPPEDKIYEWSRLCSFDDVKVVIIGQDPYHGPGQAHGLCFSVLPGVRIPPSLLNMYKELTEDIPGFKNPGHGHLIGWAKQGVLLLNACLTVRKGEANSHSNKGWEQFTDAVIEALNKKHSGLVFILWGSYAQKKGSKIDKKKHLVIQGVHPSPLSAMRGFFGSKHFSKTNEYLKSTGKTPINWQDVNVDGTSTVLTDQTNVTAQQATAPLSHQHVQIASSATPEVAYA
eukprot:comp39527_c0_seq1/m.47388 comp39527_c0_seq1/g.47388  ORF comp39527_c0_seq1/g.47388 comp39527_c0_seq1/m.47388 type:complete len:354 (-) comp39527_c0_seq1:27-1088(-)